MSESTSPVYYEGRLISKTRDMFYTYEGDAYNDATDAYGNVKFTFSTAFTWTVNYTAQTVESYRITRREARNWVAVQDIREDSSAIATMKKIAKG